MSGRFRSRPELAILSFFFEMESLRLTESWGEEAVILLRVEMQEWKSMVSCAETR